MSNSALVDYTKISPNRTSPRKNKIDTITIHCVVGQCSVETLGAIFAPSSRQASSNYGIGYDGRFGMYCEEKERSWCSSSAANDNRAITIEVASDATEPYAVNDKAYAALLDLVTDICRRNGIKKLVWSTNKNTRVNHLNGCNMTVHRDYANKSCPGTYLLGLFFLGAAALLLPGKLVFLLFGQLGQRVRAFAHAGQLAQRFFRALQQFPGGILELYFGHVPLAPPCILQSVGTVNVPENKSGAFRPSVRRGRKSPFAPVCRWHAPASRG